MKVELELNEQGDETDRVRRTLDDVVWLVEGDGGWRLAKASSVLYAAFAAYTVPDDLLEAPDLAAQEREYERKIQAEREREEAADASFVDPELAVFDCGGPETSYDDASHDL